MRSSQLISHTSIDLIPNGARAPNEGLYPKTLESNDRAREEIQPREPGFNEVCVGARGERNKQRWEDIKQRGARGNLQSDPEKAWG